MSVHATARIGHALKRILSLAGGKVSGAVCFMDNHYTPLAVLVAGVAGTAIIFIAGSLNRYEKFDWWNWKRRAAWSSARLWVLLLLTKGGLQILR